MKYKKLGSTAYAAEGIDEYFMRQKLAMAMIPKIAKCLQIHKEFSGSIGIEKWDAVLRIKVYDEEGEA